MKRNSLLLATLLIAILATSFLLIILNHTTESNSPAEEENSQEFLVGIQAGYGGVAEVKALVDRVKNFTNLFVVSATTVTAYEPFRNEVCDYIYDAGLKFIIYFRDYDFANNNPDAVSFVVWLMKAKEKYGDNFLGAYLYDEPGGKVLEKNTFIPAGSYEQASEYFTSNIDEKLNPYFYVGNFVNFSVLTADFGIYWFDYKGGYDCVLVEYGVNHSRPLHTALCRGAANVHNKDWGVIMTHTYNQPPYIESGAELYEDLVTSYTLGAKYAVVFNFGKNETENTQFPILTDEHYDAIEDFWNYIHDNPDNYGTVKADVALVLPKDYGFGFRNPDDTIWGKNVADHWTRKMLEDVNSYVDEYGFRLDIVFSDTEFNDGLQDYYDEVFVWNSGAEAGSYSVVNLNNSLGYDTIQEALDSGSTSSGDTIFVKAGTYQENLVISKPVNLMGGDKETTIIDGGGMGTVVEVDVPFDQYGFVQSEQVQYFQEVNVSISGFTMRNSGENESDAGVSLSTFVNTTLSDNIITDNHIGIQFIKPSIITTSPITIPSNNRLRNNNIHTNKYNFGAASNILPAFLLNDIDDSNTVDGKPIIYWINEHDKTVPSDAGYVALVNCTGITVQNLELTNNYNGLLLVNTKESTFSGNVFAGNYEGVILSGSSDNLLRDNSIEDSVISFNVRDGLANDIDSSNTVDGKPIIYWVDEHDRTVPSDAGYVALVNCSDITIQTLNLTNGRGILLSNTSNSVISQNTLTNQNIGIQLLNSSNNTIADNRITDCNEGIRFESSSTNTVIDNVLEANEICGFNFLSSNYNVLTGNSLTDCNNGIMLGNATYNTISRNALTANEFGVQIYDFNYINDQYPNINNALWRTANNTFHHNNFINNTKHVQSIGFVPSEDFWDYAGEGNYWDTYNGTDANRDGIGDTPYIIEPASVFTISFQDSYPLIKPVEIP